MPTSVAIALASSEIGAAIAASEFAYEAIASVSWLTATQISTASSFIETVKIAGRLASRA